MAQVRIVPGNPLDLRPEDLEPLVEQIKAEHGLTVDIHAVPQRGYGVTWWEVLIIYLASKGADAVVGHAFQALIDGIVDKTKRWYRERRAKVGNKRPLSLEFRDDDGNVLRKLELHPTGEIVEVEVDKEQEKLRPRPKGTDEDA